MYIYQWHNWEICERQRKNDDDSKLKLMQNKSNFIKQELKLHTTTNSVETTTITTWKHVTECVYVNGKLLIMVKTIAIYECRKQQQR